MDYYGFFKDFAGPISTAFAALTAATVTGVFAYRQWKTSHIQAEIALDKLKVETFAERLKVLEATRKIMRLAINAKPNELPDLEEMKKQRDVIINGKFLFRKEIIIHLNKLIDRSYRALDFDSNPNNEPMTQERRDEIYERYESIKYIIGEMQRLPDMLEDDLSPNFLRNTASISQGSDYWSSTVHGSKIVASYAIIIIGALLTLALFLAAILNVPR